MIRRRTYPNLSKSYIYIYIYIYPQEPTFLASCTNWCHWARNSFPVEMCTFQCSWYSVMRYLRSLNWLMIVSTTETARPVSNRESSTYRHRHWMSDMKPFDLGHGYLQLLHIYHRCCKCIQDDFTHRCYTFIQGHTHSHMLDIDAVVLTQRCCTFIQGQHYSYIMHITHIDNAHSCKINITPG